MPSRIRSKSPSKSAMYPGTFRIASSLAAAALLALAFVATISLPAGSQEEGEELLKIDVSDASPEQFEVAQYKWRNRLFIAMAESPFDPRFVEQMQYLEGNEKSLIERDVVVLLDTNPALGSALRSKFRPRDFVILLVGKDGTVVLRKPSPWNVRELSNAIDKLPIRQQELKSR